MKELKFIHITKCAGTSIENIGIYFNIKWGRFDPTIPFWHYPQSQLSIPTQLKFDWFVIVRHPLTRLVSEFYCKWGGPSFLIETKLDFNNFLINQLKSIQKDPWVRNGHYTPQYLYIEKSISKKIHILYFEDLENQFNNLMIEYGLECKLNKKDNEASNNNFTLHDFNQELIDLICIVYAKDFELFGYELKNLNKKNPMRCF